MIGVIADDLSGAAELGAHAVSHGLTAEVQTVFDGTADADVIVISTESRSHGKAEASRRVRSMSRMLAAVETDWIYKQTDSVLRGHVRSEVESVMAVFGYDRTVLVPANPSRGRVVCNGQYLIHDRPLNTTAFAEDPEFPATSADVATLVGPGEGIVVPDVVDAADLARVAAGLDDGVLAAGAADFFCALLERGGAPRRRSARRARHDPAKAGVSLFVCGSAAAWQTGRADQCAIHGVPVVAMPDRLFLPQRAPAAMADWATAIGEGLQTSHAVMAAIAREGEVVGVSPDVLVARLVETAVAVFRQRRVERLFVEGGETAAALVQTMGWKRLQVCDPLGEGLARLRPVATEGVSLVAKPGSYPWPPDAWQW